MEVLLIILFAPLAIGLGFALLSAVCNLIVALSESKLFWGTVGVLVFLSIIALQVSAG